jgi:hypothetical protein
MLAKAKETTALRVVPILRDWTGSQPMTHLRQHPSPMLLQEGTE